MADVPAMARLELPEQDLPHKREVARRLDGIARRGQVGWTSTVTLIADGTSTTTTVKSELLSSTSQISFSPRTPEAAALLGKVSVGTITPETGGTVGSAVIQHPSLLVGVVATFTLSIHG